MKDAIKPDHYKVLDGRYSAIDVIKDLYQKSKNDGFTDYNRFQAFKYLWRCGHKDAALQDLKKAVQFLQFAIEHEEKKVQARDLYGTVISTGTYTPAPSDANFRISPLAPGNSNIKDIDPTGWRP